MIKKFKIFKEHFDIDPYSEEDWSDKPQEIEMSLRLNYISPSGPHYVFIPQREIINENKLNEHAKGFVDFCVQYFGLSIPAKCIVTNDELWINHIGREGNIEKIDNEYIIKNLSEEKNFN